MTEFPAEEHGRSSSLPGTTTFRTLLADPPWPERGAGRIKRGADRHYMVLSVNAIAHVIRASGYWRPARSAHLYLWATNNYVPAALDVMRDLGFRYVTMITWLKESIGLGQYFRGQTEQLLFGVCGNGFAARRAGNALSTGVVAPRVRDTTGRRVHSAKPDAFYNMIESRSRGPRLELFARGRRRGWTSWGNELV